MQLIMSGPTKETSMCIPHVDVGVQGDPKCRIAQLGVASVDWRARVNVVN